MAFSLLAQTSIGTATGDTVATPPIVTTGADLLVCAIGRYKPNAGTVTDSKGNTWVLVSAADMSGNPEIAVYYSLPTSVGSGHTFTATGSSSFQSIAATAWSGCAPAPVVHSNGDAASATSVTVSATPNGAGDLIVFSGAHGTGANPITMGPGITILQTVDLVSAVHYGLSLGYAIAASSSAVSLTYTPGGGTAAMAAQISTFSAAAVSGGVTLAVLEQSYRQRRAS